MAWFYSLFPTFNGLIWASPIMKQSLINLPLGAWRQNPLGFAVFLLWQKPSKIRFTNPPNFNSARRQGLQEPQGGRLFYICLVLPSPWPSPRGRRDSLLPSGEGLGMRGTPGSDARRSLPQHTRFQPGKGVPHWKRCGSAESDVPNRHYVVVPVPVGRANVVMLSCPVYLPLKTVPCR